MSNSSTLDFTDLPILLFTTAAFACSLPGLIAASVCAWASFAAGLEPALALRNTVMAFTMPVSLQGHMDVFHVIKLMLCPNYIVAGIRAAMAYAW